MVFFNSELFSCPLIFIGTRYLKFIDLLMVRPTRRIKLKQKFILPSTHLGTYPIPTYLPTISNFQENVVGSAKLSKF